MTREKVEFEVLALSEVLNKMQVKAFQRDAFQGDDYFFSDPWWEIQLHYKINGVPYIFLPQVLDIVLEKGWEHKAKELTEEEITALSSAIINILI